MDADCDLMATREMRTRPPGKPGVTGSFVGIGSTLISATILILAAIWGAHLHHQTWDATEPIRFRGDITNAYNQGRRSAEVGLWDTYDKVAATSRKNREGRIDYSLDYPPLRLAMAHYWYRWTSEKFPDVKDWQNTRQFNSPLLLMNEVLLAMAAAATFGLVHLARRWQAKHRLGDANPTFHTGLIASAIGAALVWLSPPAMLVGFGWPQWDIAVPAFFLTSLFLACRNAWVLAGVVIAIGSLFKGQTLVGVPLLAIWPIVAGRPLAAVRFLIGFLLAAGVIMTPFAMHKGHSPARSEIVWFGLAGLLPWLLGIARPRAGNIRWFWWIAPAAIVVAVCTMAGLIAAWLIGAAIGGAAAILVYILAQKLPWRHQLTLPALGLVVAIWSTALLSDASWNWLKIGILWGSDHYQAMVMGAPSNLAAILPQFQVNRPSLVAFTCPDWLWSYEVTWKALLRSIFVIGSVMCAIAMGIHYRRRNPAFLLAAATCWLLFVTFPAQIHERYVLYPAIASACVIAMGFGWTMMHIAIALIAVLPVLHGMLGAGQHALFLADTMEPGFGARLFQYVRVTHPGMGWALITITLVCLWKSMDLRRPKVLKESPGA